MSSLDNFICRVAELWRGRIIHKLGRVTVGRHRLRRHCDALEINGVGSSELKGLATRQTEI
jgi:hypothetical protein